MGLVPFPLLTLELADFLIGIHYKTRAINFKVHSSILAKNFNPIGLCNGLSERLEIALLHHTT